MNGQQVCRSHGGNSPQARRSAEERLQDLVASAIGVSAKCLRQRRNLPLAHKAAVDVLNRTGVGPEQGYSAEQVVGLIRGVTSLFLEVVSDAHLRRQFALGLSGGSLQVPTLIWTSIHRHRAHCRSSKRNPRCLSCDTCRAT